MLKGGGLASLAASLVLVAVCFGHASDAVAVRSPDAADAQECVLSASSVISVAVVESSKKHRIVETSELIFGSPPAFAVTIGTSCTTDAECDDGVFCNGEEVCGAGGVCEAGTVPECDDGVGCTADG